MLCTLTTGMMASGKLDLSAIKTKDSIKVHLEANEASVSFERFEFYFLWKWFSFLLPFFDTIFSRSNEKIHQPTFSAKMSLKTWNFKVTKIEFSIVPKQKDFSKIPASNWASKDQQTIAEVIIISHLDSQPTLDCIITVMNPGKASKE